MLFPWDAPPAAERADRRPHRRESGGATRPGLRARRAALNARCWRDPAARSSPRSCRASVRTRSGSACSASPWRGSGWPSRSEPPEPGAGAQPLHPLRLRPAGAGRWNESARHRSPSCSGATASWRSAASTRRSRRRWAPRPAAGPGGAVHRRRRRRRLPGGPAVRSRPGCPGPCARNAGARADSARGGRPRGDPPRRPPPGPSASRAKPSPLPPVGGAGPGRVSRFQVRAGPGTVLRQRRPEAFRLTTAGRRAADHPARRRRHDALAGGGAPLTVT